MRFITWLHGLSFVHSYCYGASVLPLIGICWFFSFPSIFDGRDAAMNTPMYFFAKHMAVNSDLLAVFLRTLNGT